MMEDKRSDEYRVYRARGHQFRALLGTHYAAFFISITFISTFRSFSIDKDRREEKFRLKLRSINFLK